MEQPTFGILRVNIKTSLTKQIELHIFTVCKSIMPIPGTPYLIIDFVLEIVNIWPCPGTLAW